MENIVAINPSDFHHASITLGWNKIIGCVITHFLFGKGKIVNIDDLIHIQFFDDIEADERRFDPNIFLGNKVHDLEVPVQLAKSVEEALGHQIITIDINIAGRRYEMYQNLEQLNFDRAEELFQDIKHFLIAQDIQNYQSTKNEYKKQFTIQQDKILVEKTFREIDEKLKHAKFSEARELFKRIIHLSSEEDFEQIVLGYQIPFEISHYNFKEADDLYRKCKPNTIENYLDLKATAIQNYFNKLPTKVTKEQALALSDQSNALLIKA